MSKGFIRFWVEEDVAEVVKHLLIVGESFSDCANCRELGLDYSALKECPKCHTAFRYVTSRQAAGASMDRFRWLRKIRERRPELKFVDYDDIQKLMAQTRAREFLK